MQPCIDMLAKHSSRTCNVQEYLSHIKVKMKTWSKFRERMSLKAPRRWAFETYQNEQRAVQKLATDLQIGTDHNVLVVWGDGGFGPTSEGTCRSPKSKTAQYAQSIRSYCAGFRVQFLPAELLSQETHDWITLRFADIFMYQQEYGTVPGYARPKESSI